MLFIKENNGWYELDKVQGIAYNYEGGHHYVNIDTMEKATIVHFDSWHALYLSKNYCPFEADKTSRTAWLSPDGKFYEGRAHEVLAEDLCDIIYGLNSMWAGDELEERGWIRVTTSLMWEIRLEELKNKKLTKKQIDALWDWCQYHNKTYPY